MDPAARRLGGFLALGGLMVVVDTTVVVVTVPRLVREFGVSLATVQWATAGYALALVAVLPLAAWAAARFGARATYLASLAAFTGASLLTGLAWNVGALIAFRVLQGLGGGLLNPVGTAIALAAAPPERRGAMMSLLGLPVLVGPLAGPLLAGVLVDHASWRWVFWLNVPIGVAALLLGRRLLPAPPADRDPVPLDVAGLLLLSPGVTLVVLGLSGSGSGSGTMLAALAGAALVAVFVVRSRRAAVPLLRLDVLRQRATAAGAATVALFAAAYFGAGLVGPLYVQIVRGDPATAAGALALPQALATGLTLQVATRLVDRFPARRIVGLGITTAFSGTVLLVAVLDAHTPYPALAAIGALTGVGVGATIMPVMTAATRELPADRLPSATTVLNIVSQTAIAAGTAIVTAVLSWRAGAHAGLSVAEAAGLTGQARADHAPALAAAVRDTLAAQAALMAAAWLAARRLPRGSDVPYGPAVTSQSPATTASPGDT
ncbi:DHA2 family efflux MFS transporter permease subunit [Dactylosporangium sp. AC04546]|uniref:DHA2 family efflux MFS transporter permease subunit n=1 Tax=Dactylosporangium sp. AC04546 TaxID=2862460 RepID=UPI001EDDBC25|nr:DHA2 family efflux MFS transporter permease subunit [Dactylosporangium sp. AC04546]WVK79994.1 DHA2 family efflux MFS transporter permease subunit [Dactylosporangium sp. AC04546]